MIQSARFEASGDTPEQVVEAFNLAFDRLGLGAGGGRLFLGSHEFVIEGIEGGGYKGRIKLNFGPMGAAAEKVWRDGGDPYGKDREVMERLRDEEGYGLGPVAPLDEDLPRTIPDLHIVTVITKGKDVSVPIASTTYATLIKWGALNILAARGDISTALSMREIENEWELRDADGDLIGSTECPVVNGNKQPYYLDRKPGVGG